MKKLLPVIAVLSIIALIGAGIFIATFDINTYKKAIESQLETVMGNPVEIDRLSLAWKGRIELGVEGFVVSVEEDGKKVPALSFERAGAAVELMPLLQGRLQISSLAVARPAIQLIRKKDGKIELRGYNPKPVAAKAEKAAAAAGPALGFSISVIDIKEGVVRFQDFMSNPASDIVIRAFDARLADISLTTPVRFDVKMAVAAKAQNVSLSGTAGGFAAGNIFLKNLDGQADLSKVDHAELMKGVPSLKQSGLKDGLAGVLKMKVRELEFAGSKVSKLSADVNFTDGALALEQLKVPIERINLDASAEGSAVSVRSFSAHLANAALDISGKIDDLFATPRTAMKAAIGIEGLRSFLATALAANQNIDGNAKLSFDGTMTGRSWPEIQNTLSGSGEFSLEKGVVVDTNILSQAIDAITIFPGLLGSVGIVVPEEAKKALASDYTLLKPIRQQYTIKDNYAALPGLSIETDFLSLRGDARMSLTGDLSGRGMLSFSPDMSGALIKTVPQMKYIANSKGLVEFPIDFKGGGGAFKVFPDLKYIGQKVAMQKAGEMAMDYLGKKLAEGAKPAGSQTAPSGESKASKVESFLKGLEAAMSESEKASK